MSEYSGHNEGLPSNISSVEDTGNITEANSGLSKHNIAELQRQSYLGHSEKEEAKRRKEAEDLMQLVLKTTPETLEAPLIQHGASAANVWRGAGFLAAARMDDAIGFDWVPTPDIDDAA